MCARPSSGGSDGSRVGGQAAAGAGTEQYALWPAPGHPARPANGQNESLGRGGAGTSKGGSRPSGVAAPTALTAGAGAPTRVEAQHVVSHAQRPGSELPAGRAVPGGGLAPTHAGSGTGRTAPVARQRREGLAHLPVCTHLHPITALESFQARARAPPLTTACSSCPRTRWPTPRCAARPTRS